MSCVQQDGAASLKSILDNFETLLKVWEISLEQVKDTEMKARIRGAATQMMKFDFYFRISLGLLLIQWHTDIILAKRCKRQIYQQQKDKVSLL